MSMQVRRRDALKIGAGLSATALGACATEKTPSPADALGDLDATGVAARIRSGEITALEAVDAAIARAQALEPKINSIATAYFESARARAQAPGLSGPFAGVPTLVKDLSDIAGEKTMYGARAYRDNVAAATGAFVAQALSTGLVSLGKSTTPEFGYTATTEPLVTGPTRNPWNTAHSSGGSSGGSAAAVAAGLAPIATASDGGGSVRIPAACCGLFGLKVSRGRLVGSEGARPPVDISVDGCLSRSVRDTAAFLAATEREDAPYPKVGLITAPTKAKLRIGVIIPSAVAREPDADVRAATEAAAALCKDLGHELVEATYPIDGAAFAQAFGLYWAFGALEDVGRFRAANPKADLQQAFEPLTLGLVDQASKASRQDLERAIGVLKRSEAEYATMFERMDVLLTPVLAKAPLPIGALAPTLAFEENQRVVFDYVGYTPLQNATGAAAMSVPLAWSDGGLPIGAHFAGKAGDEALLLGLAYQLEQARPWAGKRPPVWAG